MSLLKNIRANRIAELYEEKSLLVSELNSLQDELIYQSNLVISKNSDSSRNGCTVIAAIIGLIIGIMFWNLATGKEIDMSDNFFLSFLQAFGGIIGTFFILVSLSGFSTISEYINSSSDATDAKNEIENIKLKLDNLKEQINNIENKIRKLENSQL